MRRTTRRPREYRIGELARAAGITVSNTGLGHNSVVFMIECQVRHVLSCLRLLARENAETIEVSAPALRRFSDGIQRRLRRAVWSQGGCTSWYLDADRVNRALRPGFSFEYWRAPGAPARPTTRSAEDPACRRPPRRGRGTRRSRR